MISFLRALLGGKFSLDFLYYYMLYIGCVWEMGGAHAR